MYLMSDRKICKKTNTLINKLNKNLLHEGRATITALLLLLFRRVEGVAVAPVDGSVLELAQRGRAPLAEALFAAVVVGAAGIPFPGEVENRFLLLRFADAARAGREDGPNAIGDTDMTVDFVTVVFCASPVRGTRRHDLAAGLA